MSARTIALVVVLTLSVAGALASDVGNRLTYLDEFCDPYYTDLNTPKLITPQWIGEEGVEAVIVLANDDLRDPEKHEKFMRPILQRLKKIDGRASVSLMANIIPFDHPLYDAWQREGVNLGTHTSDHPCPCLQDNDFVKSKATFDTCVDLLTRVTDGRAVSFRMPCCDSMNSVSPRFFTEIFGKTTPGGNFVSVDSSIFLLFTPNDPALPRSMVLDADGQEKFRKYVPTDRVMANLVEDYPYPFVVGRLAWEIPSLMPSDWDAQHLQGKCSPTTVADFKTAMDAVVIKRGIFSLCYHTHGWISNDQVVDMIDHAQKQHGRKIKFLSFLEVLQRLGKNLLGGHPIRASGGQDNGVRLVDLDNDGYLDVVIANQQVQQTRIWKPATSSWATSSFPVPIVDVDDQGNRRDGGVRFGVLQENGFASIIVQNEASAGTWHFDGSRWIAESGGLEGLDGDPAVFTSLRGRDRGVRLRDLDGDGKSELIVGNPQQNAVFRYRPSTRSWQRLPIRLPEGTTIVDEAGRDAGLRFVDFDEDGRADVVFSNAERYSAHVFNGIADGWSREMLSGRRGRRDASDGGSERKDLPMIVRADGSNNGVWFNYRHMWVQNEETGKALPDHVDSRFFTDDFLAAEKEPPPRSPLSGLRSLKPRSGFVVQQMAAEPLVMDPIDIAWGPDGKAWVAEMADYPMGIDNQGRIGGRIRCLEDTDGDGRYDRSTVFLEPVGFPSGVMPWRGGVIVSAAPLVFYAEDTDGDGVADVRETLLTGFNQGNQQHRVNSPRWMLDNWISLANGDSNGLIRSVKSGRTLDITGLDLRFRPDDGALEAQTGRTQHGRSRDDWGNWYGCNNANPGWNYILDDHYIRRNPHVAPPTMRLDLNQYRDAYPAGRVMTHCFYDQPTPPEGHPGRWTGICGLTIYRDEFLGPDYRGDLFVSDAVYNVVHHLRLAHDGLRVRGQRGAGEEQSEFLASTDPWFRPTTIRTGPDGALWVADMYRHVIEHPQWIDDRLEQTLDLRHGHDRGRIYRIYPVGETPRPIPRLDQLDTAGLVAALDSPNGWQRDMAQQMLLWRDDQAAVGPLAAMVKSNSRALARLHALCTLDGLGALSADVVVHALTDEHPGVRRRAIRLSESLVNSNPKVGETLLTLMDDEDPYVRLQLCYSLGQWNDAKAAEALGQLAIRYQQDRYLTAAVISSAVPHIQAMIANVRVSGGPDPLLQRLEKLAKDIQDHPHAGERGIAAVPGDLAQPGENIISRLPSPRIQAALDKFAPVLNIKGDAVRGKQVFVDATCSTCHRLEDVGENLGPDIKTLVDRSPQNLLQAIIDPNQQVKERYVQYVAITADGLSYTGLLLERTSTSITLADSKGVKTTLLGRDLEELVATQKSFMSEGLEEPLTLEQLADLMAFLGKIGMARRRIPGNKPTTLLTAQDRSLQLTPATAEIYGEELNFHPDSGQIDSWTNAEAYLVWSIHLQGAQKFDVWVDWACDDAAAGNPFLIEAGAETIRGNVPATGAWNGYRWDKLGKLTFAAGSYRVGFRSDGPISGPLVNLRRIKFTKPGQLPQPPQSGEIRTTPQLAAVPAEADGTIHLTAERGEAKGPSIKFMPQWKAFGWFTDKDQVQWDVQIPRGGYYDAWMEWSVDDQNAGKPWDLKVGGKRLIGAAGKTGSWETYRKMKIGRLELKAGRQKAVFSRGGGFEGPLLDLREITLVPVPPDH